MSFAPPQKTRSPGQIFLGGEPMVIHCNHYNRFLQMVVEGCQSVDGVGLQLEAAQEVVYRQLSGQFAAQPLNTAQERLRWAAEQYAYCGFGHLNMGNLPDSPPAEWIVREDYSHYANALLLNRGSRNFPGELFDLGYCAASLTASYNFPYQGDIALPNTALSAGGTQTLFHLHQAPEHREIFRGFTRQLHDAHAVQTDIPPKSCARHMDEQQILEEMSNLSIQGNPESGLIDAFGVQLTVHYADYYNLLSFRFEKALKHALQASPFLIRTLAAEYPVLEEYKDFGHLQGDFLARTLLTEAGHICGFRTMGGIMMSTLWKEKIMPMIRDQSDWIHGIVAVINSLGWGVWRVTELIPDQRLILRAWKPYESLGYLRAFGISDTPVDYLFAGVASALMNLIFHVNITDRPTLDDTLYTQAMHEGDHFWAKQNTCVAQGHPYSEVIVERGILRDW